MEYYVSAKIDEIQRMIRIKDSQMETKKNVIRMKNETFCLTGMQ